MNWETVWTFKTRNFEISLAVAPEQDDPANHFDEFADIEFAREGGWHWFEARVQVAFVDHDNPKKWAMTRKRVMGEDYLGACSYHDLADFKSCGYFRDMVREAIAEARSTIRSINQAHIARYTHIIERESFPLNSST